MQINRLVDDRELFVWDKLFDFSKISKVTIRALLNYGTVRSSKFHLVKKVPY